MIVDRIFTPGLAQVAYLVADEGSGRVAVIDPRRDVDAYLEWSARRGYRIEAILETHVHADFVSGAFELHNRTGAPIYASRLGNQEFSHIGLDNGDRITLGSVTLRALWTPGHTPEHMAFELLDATVRPEPLALFSGDLLFVGEVGRPDLLGAAHTSDLANQLFETLTSRLDHLPDDVVVYPGHTAGSSCGRKIGEAPHTTMGNERIGNYALQFSERDAFVQAILEAMPTPPAYYPRMKIVNKVGPQLLAHLQSGATLDADAVAGLIEEGAALIDARSAAAFDAAHIPGAFYAGNTADFVNWAGWLAPFDRPIVLVLDDDSRFDEMVADLRRIGLDSVAGYLRGGMRSWIEDGNPVESLAEITPEQLQASLTAGDPVMIVDVRTQGEWLEGHIPGSTNTFAGDIVTGAAEPHYWGGSIALTCTTGYRSRVAASHLQASGVDNIVQVAGGMEAWRALGYPMEAA